MTTTVNPTIPSFTPPDPFPANPNPQVSVSPDEEAAMRHVRRIRGFYSHLTQYVTVISILAVINLFSSPKHIWVFWPAMGWGLGIFFHGLRVFGTMPLLNADWEKRQVEKYLGRKL